MRTLGIDLASQPAKTAVCLVEWAADVARVVEVVVGADDDRLLELVREADRAGIDAPFGWPRPFVALLAAHRDGVAGDRVWTPVRRDALRFRRTDVVVREALGRWPLSVSSDLIAIVAMRCAGLLDRLGIEDRSGLGQVVETYPAVALRRWGLRSRGYKGNPTALAALLSGLRAATPWLICDQESAALCGRSDHAFDALVSALVARAAALGLTARPGAEERELARLEGWIAIPEGGSLAPLASGRGGGVGEP